MQVDSSIFKAYDIRGVVDKTLTEDVARAVGRVLGSLAVEANVSAFCVGRDGRLSGERLMNALVEGIASTGMKVLDVGAVPTPVLYYATKYFNCGTGVAVTGSHNPPEWNGLKMMVAGITLFADAIQDIRRRVEAQDWIEAAVPGAVEKVDAVTPYVEKALAGIKIERRLKVAADAGSGIAGPVMLQLLSKLPVDVVPLFCEPDGRFPFHHPDPSKPKNLEDLIKTVKTEDCDYGFALDGDGDRLGVVTKQGEIIFPDRLMMLFAEDILKHHPGEPIVYDVKCSRKLVDWVKAKGGVPTISPTGHSLVKAKLRDTHAPFAGEMSGHLFFNDERWTGFDDGLYAAVRLLEILSRTDDPSGVLSKLPNAVNTPELQIPMAEGEPKRFIERLRAQAGQFADAADVIKVDGLRVEWKDGFALARSSNTTPVVVLRFEGDTPEALKRVKTRFIEVLRSIEPNLVIPE
ncbi:phosphomannomutase/phosphoglucomutase [Sutterella wadsworthensis]|uniref:phosphomannomutase/phosphoglucomutase n=2 Tax=Sutterella wadsworthensis TaxID=40545 RepID=UPI00266C08B6|nr:phosphomannomutase/phosphoglucomutase [Sutterella wadsworthensis]